MWVNRSGHSQNEQFEQITQVAHHKWATMIDSLTKNEQIACFFWANRSFDHYSLIFLQKTSNSLRKPMSKFPTLVSIIRRSQALRCASYREVKLRSVHHIAESKCTLRSQKQKFCWSLVALKGTNRRNPFRSEHLYHERKELRYEK